MTDEELKAVAEIEIVLDAMAAMAKNWDREAKALKERLAEVEAERDELQQKLTERFDDEVLNMVPRAEREVVKACPRCGW